MGCGTSTAVSTVPPRGSFRPGDNELVYSRPPQHPVYPPPQTANHYSPGVASNSASLYQVARTSTSSDNGNQADSGFLLVSQRSSAASNVSRDSGPRSSVGYVDRGLSCSSLDASNRNSLGATTGSNTHGMGSPSIHGDTAPPHVPQSPVSESQSPNDLGFDRFPHQSAGQLGTGNSVSPSSASGSNAAQRLNASLASSQPSNLQRPIQNRIRGKKPVTQLL